MKTYAFIFARGGSKGLPGKNIKMFAGKPMLAHSIEMAMNIDEIERVFVSTDDSEIADTALRWGAEVINRPGELAQDNSPEWLAWLHAVKYVNTEYGIFDKFISLPVTAPLRAKEDVENCLSALREGVDMIVTVTESGRNPFFNMVRIDESDAVHLFSQGSKRITRRQDAPKAYDMTTVAYVTRPEFVLKSRGVFDGVVHAVIIPQERAIDIDTPVDFTIAACLSKKVEGYEEYS